MKHLQIDRRKEKKKPSRQSRYVARYIRSIGIFEKSSHASSLGGQDGGGGISVHEDHQRILRDLMRSELLWMMGRAAAVTSFGSRVCSDRIAWTLRSMYLYHGIFCAARLRIRIRYGETSVS
jgi:hypothetical protein